MVECVYEIWRNRFERIVRTTIRGAARDGVVKLVFFAFPWCEIHAGQVFPEGARTWLRIRWQARPALDSPERNRCQYALRADKDRARRRSSGYRYAARLKNW